MPVKITAISILIAAVLIGGVIVLTGGRNGSNGIATQAGNNVRMTDGKQIIEINAKGGYAPRMTVAKAGLPTVIRVDTRSTFDCSSALTIPSLGYRKNLPSSGETLIEVPPQNSGSVLQGLCAMGMYNFVVKFN